MFCWEYGGSWAPALQDQAEVSWNTTPSESVWERRMARVLPTGENSKFWMTPSDEVRIGAEEKAGPLRSG